MGSTTSKYTVECDGTGRNCPNAMFGSPCAHGSGVVKKKSNKKNSTKKNT